MKIIEATGEYKVYVGENITEEISRWFCVNGKDTKVLVVTDSNVAPLYLAETAGALKKSGAEVFSFVINAGENSKTPETLIEIWNSLAGNSFSRSDIIVALGGGVVGDTAGFAAATYMRGVRFVNIPTTLLAMVDSCVGSKTAVNLTLGKNLAGCFYSPQAVFCDTRFIGTLPERYISDAMAEVIKYGMLGDEDFLTYLSENEPDYPYIIEKCLETKFDYISGDLEDRSKRRMLNFGHTYGHAVESLSAYTVSHGRAVALGMVLISRRAAENGLCSKEVPEKLALLLKKYSLPVECDISMEKTVTKCLNDKKREGGSITVVVPVKYGNCELKNFSFSEFSKFSGVDL